MSSHVWSAALGLGNPGHFPQPWGYVLPTSNPPIPGWTTPSWASLSPNSSSVLHPSTLSYLHRFPVQLLVLANAYICHSWSMIIMQLKVNLCMHPLSPSLPGLWASSLGYLILLLVRNREAGVQRSSKGLQDNNNIALLQVGAEGERYGRHHYYCTGGDQN